MHLIHALRIYQGIRWLEVLSLSWKMVSAMTKEKRMLEKRMPSLNGVVRVGLTENVSKESKEEMG